MFLATTLDVKANVDVVAECAVGHYFSSSHLSQTKGLKEYTDYIQSKIGYKYTKLTLDIAVHKLINKETTPNKMLVSNCKEANELVKGEYK